MVEGSMMILMAVRQLTRRAGVAGLGKQQFTQWPLEGISYYPLLNTCILVCVVPVGSVDVGCLCAKLL